MLEVSERSTKIKISEDSPRDASSEDISQMQRLQF